MLDVEEAMRLYNRGKSDKVIAQTLDVTQKAVRMWRVKMGLIKNPEKRKYALTPLEQDAKAALEMGMTYGRYVAAGRPQRV